MRPSRATAAFLLSAFVVALSGCGVEAGRAERTTDEIVADVCQPIVEGRHAVITGGKTLDPWWAGSSCDAITRPPVILARMMPAMVEDGHDREPYGEHWDWPAIAASCRELSAAVPTITSTADTAPEGADEVAELLREYAAELRAFSTECLIATETRDYPAMKAASPRLTFMAEDILPEIESATMEAILAERDGN